MIERSNFALGKLSGDYHYTHLAFSVFAIVGNENKLFRTKVKLKPELFREIASAFPFILTAETLQLESLSLRKEPSLLISLPFV